MGGPFTEMLKIAEKFDNAPMQNAMARMEASKFIGEDGKEYFRLPLARSGALTQADGYAEAYSSGCPPLKVRHSNLFRERIKSEAESYPNGCPIIPESND